MSLLIKALQKAEQQSAGHKVASESELSLAPKHEQASSISENEALQLAQEAGLTNAAWDKKVGSQETAAFVFESKTAVPTKSNRGPLLAGLLLGVLLMVAGGLYYLEQQLNAPALTVAPRVTPIEGNAVVSQNTPVPSSAVPTAPAEVTPSSVASSEGGVNGQPSPSAANTMQDSKIPVEQAVEPTSVSNAVPNASGALKSSEGRVTPSVVKANENLEASAGQAVTQASAQRAEDDSAHNAPQKNDAKAISAKAPLTRSLPVPKALAKSAERSYTAPTGVSRGKVLESGPAKISEAYQALVAGEDDKAHRLYWQLLKTDSRNVDAMLGLATIAQRQGKLADAQGWYAKVLELDPRNEFALAASHASVPPSDPVNEESRLLSMVAQQPKSASLQASLGNFYAEQGQWAQAQQAYFEAHHLAPSHAEYTYDLAVSLDQLGKGALAAQFYREALSQLMPGQQLFDREAVQARIQALAP